MYYAYGGWAQGINLNEYPPTIAYFFGRQIYDESTQKMQLRDEVNMRRWVRTQNLAAHWADPSKFGDGIRARIVERLCVACGLCREASPEGAVHPKLQDIHHMYEVLETECTGCGNCLPLRPGTGRV